MAAIDVSRKNGTAVKKKRARKKTTPRSKKNQTAGLPAVTGNGSNGKGLSVASRYEIAQMEEPWSFDKKELEKKRIIYPEMVDRAVADAFRRIRTKIIQKSGSGNRVILVTGLDNHSGGSFTTINLAAAFAFDESKTALLLDCDLNSPGFKLDDDNHNMGLIDYLEEEDGKLGVEEIIYPIGIRRMRLVPSGGKREVVVEHFTSIKMRELVESIKVRYDERYIFINSPPIAESADAEILAEICDCAVLVVPYGRFTEKKIENAAKTIGKDKLLGIVFNDVPRIPKVSFTLNDIKMPWQKSA